MWLNSWLDASDIDVTVTDGEVTLTGTVWSREEKRRAEDIAESVPGVRHVQNNLRVGQSSGTSAAPGGVGRTEPAGSSGYASDTVAASQGEPGTGGRGGIDVP